MAVIDFPEEPGAFPPGSRADDWETSKKADQMVNATRPTMILKMLRAYEYTERTDDEAAEMMDLLDTCYWKRAGELRYFGFIEYTGQTRVGRHRVPRIVCRITDEGRRVLRERRVRQP
jgi:hypothetical protein